MQRILLLEDDEALRRGVAAALSGPDRTVVQAVGLQEAGRLLETGAFALLILDVNLPDGSGAELLRHLRQEGDRTPVILLTANDLETDIVAGLELGADDYITKPFSLAVLRARVNTQLRRGTPAAARYEAEGLSLDFDRMEFQRDGQPVELSKTEQKLLRLLVENRGRTLTRAQLVDRIWTDGAAYVDENALSVTVKRLRDKLEETPSRPRFIKTVYGLGYTWAVN